MMHCLARPAVRRLCAAWIVASIVCSSDAATPDDSYSIVTDPAQVDLDRRTRELQELKFGMFICWSFSTFSGQEWTRGVERVDAFRATEVDTDQWCKTIREAGMGYVLFLTKHHDGFCLWDTDTTAWKVTNSPLKRDVLADLKRSCDAHGLKLALYFSEGDWTWIKEPLAHQTEIDWRSGVNAEMKKAQLKELLTRYGPIEYIWFDHAQGTGGLDHPETVAWCKTLQPGCFIGFNHGDQTGADIRLGERGRPGPLDDPTAAGPYLRDAPSNSYRLAEFTYPIQPQRPTGAHWFYSLPEHEDACISAEDIYRDYLGAKQFGNLFALDAGPNYEGRLRDIDVKTLQKVGRYIRGELAPPPPRPMPISRAKASSASSQWKSDPNYGPHAAFDGNPSTRWGAAEASRNGWLAVDLGQPIKINRTVIDEGTWDRLRKFEIQYRDGDTWKPCFQGGALESNDELRFEPVLAQEFRLQVLEAREVPTIIEWELYEAE